MRAFATGSIGLLGNNLVRALEAKGYDVVGLMRQESPRAATPWNLENRKFNSWNCGRGVYFRDPNGHILKLMTQI